MQDAIMYAISRGRVDDLHRTARAADRAGEVRRVRRDSGSRWQRLLHRDRQAG